VEISLNLIRKRLRKILSKVPNVNNPSFDDNTVLDIIKNAGFSNIIEEYKRAPTGTGDNNQGSKGFWTRQLAGAGVENPIVFYCETYSFVKNGNMKTFIVSWKYDTNDNITNESSVTDFESNAISAIRTISSGTKLKNGYSVVGEYASYEAAKEAVEQDVAQYKENVV